MKANSSTAMLHRRSDLLLLVFKCGSYSCGLPIEAVLEIMRPLPITSFKDTPPFILGSSIVRGQVLPVVNLPLVLSGSAGDIGRFVAVRIGERKAVLAVEGVIGIRPVDESVLSSLPPLLKEETHKPFIQSVARIDRELLLVLNRGYLVPEEAWAAIARQH